MSANISKIFFMLFILSIALNASAMTNVKKRSLKKTERHLTATSDTYKAVQYFYTIFYGDWTYWIWAILFMLIGIPMCF